MQNLLISGLNALIKKYRFQEKILITPSLYTGQQILQHLTRESPGWINIRPSTAGLIAEDIAEPEMIKNDTRVISRVESNIIIDSIFSDLARESKLSYFKKNIINTGIIDAITAIIAELKMSGMVFTDLDTKHFINPQKAKDIKLMYRQYEETLAEKNLIDYPELINMSLGILGKKKKEKSEAKYIVLSRYKNTPLEVELINAISGGAPIIIGEEKIYGLPEPKNSWKTDDAKSSTSCFSYLFDIENIPPDCSGTGISLSSSASYQDEVDEVWEA